MAEKTPTPSTTPSKTSTKEEKDRIAAEREEEIASLAFRLTAIVEGKKMALKQRAEAKAQLQATREVFTKTYFNHVKLMEVKQNLEENARELNRADVELRKKMYIQRRQKLEYQWHTDDTLAKMRKDFQPRVKALGKANAVKNTDLRRLNIRANCLAAALQKTEAENEELEMLLFELTEAAIAAEEAVETKKEDGKVEQKNKNVSKSKSKSKRKDGHPGSDKGASGCRMQ